MSLGEEYTVELKNWVCSTYNDNSEADYPASATYDLPVEIKDSTEVSKTVNARKLSKDIIFSTNTYNSDQIKIF